MVTAGGLIRVMRSSGKSSLIDAYNFTAPLFGLSSVTTRSIKGYSDSDVLREIQETNTKLEQQNTDIQKVFSAIEQQKSKEVSPVTATSGQMTTGFSSSFSNPFFSIAGQKERLMRIPQTAFAAATGTDKISLDSMNIKTDSVLRKSTEWIANHPYKTAAIATAAKVLVSSASSRMLGTGTPAATTTATKATATSGILGTLKSWSPFSSIGTAGKVGIGVAGGWLLGSLLSGSKSTTPQQTVTQQPQQDQQSEQQDQDVSYIFTDNTQTDNSVRYNIISNSPGSNIDAPGQTLTATPTASQGAVLLPQQYQSTTSDPYQSATSSSGFGLLALGAAALVGYVLKER